VSTETLTGVTVAAPSAAPVDPVQPFTPTGTGADFFRIRRSAKLAWVPLSQMQVSPLAQRDMRNAKVNEIAGDFDPDRLGTIVVSYRDGKFYVVDGQHRVEAMRCIGWGDQQVEAWVHEGLTEQQEAKLFLHLNNQLTVNALDKFKIAVTAGDTEAAAIAEVLEPLGLRITTGKAPGTITSVGTVKRIHAKYGPEVLGRALAITKCAFGDEGLTSVVIEGIALLVARYADVLDDNRAIAKLQKINAGVHGLKNSAEGLHRTIGAHKAQCVAAKAVDAINTGRGGRKLRDWFRSEGAALDDTADVRPLRSAG